MPTIINVTNNLSLRHNGGNQWVINYEQHAFQYGISSVVYFDQREDYIAATPVIENQADCTRACILMGMTAREMGYSGDTNDLYNQIMDDIESRDKVSIKTDDGKEAAMTKVYHDKENICSAFVKYWPPCEVDDKKESGWLWINYYFKHRDLVAC